MEIPQSYNYKQLQFTGEFYYVNSVNMKVMCFCVNVQITDTRLQINIKHGGINRINRMNIALFGNLVFKIKIRKRLI